MNKIYMPWAEWRPENTKARRAEVKKLLGFAPVDSEQEELRREYLAVFGNTYGLNSFVETCGSVRDAIEVLKIDQATR